MKTLFTTFVLVAFSILFIACKNDSVRMHIIGDSTMADYDENTTQIRGWGEMLGQLVPEGVEIINHAIPGRSSRSFYDEGSWKKVTEEMREGDYVLIQFAHNDEKEKGLDGADGRGTAPWTTYREYLGKYIDETRALGGTPILVQPVVRRYFDGNNITARGAHNLSPTAADTTLDYTTVMCRVAEEKNVPMVDLCKVTRQIVESYGPTGSKKHLYVQADNTHTCAKGAAMFAIGAVEILDTMKLWQGTVRKPGIVTNPVSYDFGEVFISDTAWHCFDAVNLSGVSIKERKVLTHESTIEIVAPTGFKLAHAMGGSLQDSLLISADASATFFVYYAPGYEGRAIGTIRLSSENSHGEIQVCGNGKRINNVSEVDLNWADLCRTPEGEGLTARLSTLKSLNKNNCKFTIEADKWPADIDEDGNRFIQIVVTATEKNVVLKKISMKTTGSLSYRLSYAFGNDFFNRSVIGERQFPVDTPMSEDSYNTSIGLKADGAVLLRIFPWSREECSPIPFEITDLIIEGIGIE